MRMTSRKKEILSYFEPDSLDWVTGEIGAPRFCRIKKPSGKVLSH